MKKQVIEFIIKEKKAVISILLITFVLMTTGAVFPSLKYGINRWAMCNWAITYENGFIYRGLIGTIFKFLFGMVTEIKIYFISLCLVLSMYILISYIFIKIYSKNKDIYSFLLIMFVACLPSNIRWWATDEMYGRLDILITLIAFVCCILILNLENKTLRYISMLSLSIIAILVHEGFGMLFSSMIFALALFEANKNSNKIHLMPLYVYYIPIIVIFAVVVLTGGREAAVEEITPIFEKNVSAEFSNSMHVVVRQVITENMRGKMATVKSLQSVHVTLSMILTYVVLVPSMIIFFGTFIRMLKLEKNIKNKIILVIIIGSCFAPLCASFIAYDQFRWIGYFVICLSTALIFLCFSYEKYLQVTLEFIKNNKYYLAAIITFYLSIGVLHDMRGIGYIESIVTRLLS